MSLSFVEKVMEMRAAQRRYFKERTQSALREAKRLEQEVDSRADFLFVQLGGSRTKPEQAAMEFER